MQKAAFLLFFYLLVNAVTAQTTFHDPMAEVREVASFTSIEVQTGIQLQLTQSTTERVAVSASTVEWRDYIQTEVSDNRLKIYFKPEAKKLLKQSGNKELKAYVSCIDIKELTINSGASANIQNILKGESLSLRLHTGGTLNGEVEVSTLQIDQSTGSIINISGKSRNLNLGGNTGSGFKGKNFLCETCNVNLTTGAEALVQVTKELVAKTSTGAVLKYMGDVSVRDITKNTGGRVVKI